MSEYNQGIDFAKASLPELISAGYNVKQRPPSKIKKVDTGGRKVSVKALREHVGVGSMITPKKGRAHEGLTKNPTESFVINREEKSSPH